jgi:hypothetical protein
LTEHDFAFEIDDEELETGEEQRGPITPYAILEVEPDATPDQVRIAYHRKVREHPPERDPEGFKRVREAYDTLRSPRKRAELTLLELRQGPGEFDLDRLRDAPPPPFPERYVNHLLAIVLADADAALDAEVARARDGAPPVGSSDRGGGSAR